MDHSLYPPLLPEEVADATPFSSSQVSNILHLFSVSPDSPKAKANQDTLKTCELEPAEVYFCHFNAMETKAFKLQLVGDKVDALVVCHLVLSMEKLIVMYFLKVIMFGLISHRPSLPEPRKVLLVGKWVDVGDNGEDVKYQCDYSDSEKTPLLCSAVAFVGLVAVMLVEHVYVLIVVSKSSLPVGLVSWDLDSTHFKTFTW
ncbi:hypothetical protein V6N13_038735 [Hibiscus sabdariffa]|uniref:Uncharacterized protein n=2 Tax=Hibiscus sabdariffa TaxID=183260 RepID=A0ABR2P3F1_9ROSI